jgi:D-lactate dehydratase
VLNATFDSINADSYDALVIPGGRAPEYLSLDEQVLKLVQRFASAHKPVASICHGPLILAAAGVLKGKQCTAYPALKPTVIAAGGKWLDPEPISASFTDGNLITAAAWPGHPEFLKNLLEALGARVIGADKKVLFICGVRCYTLYNWLCFITSSWIS